MQLQKTTLERLGAKNYKDKLQQLNRKTAI